MICGAGKDGFPAPHPTPSAKSGVFFAPGLSRHSSQSDGGWSQEAYQIISPNGNIAYEKNIILLICPMWN